MHRNLRSKTTKVINNVTYTESSGLPPGVLPTKRDVAESMLYLTRSDIAGSQGRNLNDAALILAFALQSQWEYCTVYTIGYRYIRDKILDFYNVFKTNFQYRQKKTDKWKSRMDSYNADMDQIFDIYCSNDEARKRREEAVGVPMGEAEFAFLEDMRTVRKQYCDNFVDRIWERNREREEKRANLLEERELRQKQAMEKESKRMLSVSWSEVDQSETLTSSSTLDCDSEYYCVDVPTPKKKRKLTSEPTGNQLLPPMYRHVRISERKIKPEFYKVVDKLKSKHHFSDNQGKAAVVEVANGLFDCEWKYHNEGSDLDLDTLPHSKNIREAGKAQTVLALSSIVDAIMESGDTKSVISYHDDGSKKQGVGSYSVQGVTINGVFRPLPTLPIASESRENLAALKIAILNILSVCNTKYTPKDIQEAIDFKVTDSTSHNLEVEDIVSRKLETDYVPEQLLCHTHPVLMFVRKIIEFCSGN